MRVHSFLLEALIPLFMGIFFVASLFVKGYLRRRRAPDLAGTPILLSYYSQEFGMMPVKKGQLADMRYTGILVLNEAGNIIDNWTSGLLYRIELPFESNVHLLGIPKGVGAVPLNPQGDSMESVHLEGNYSKYFALYAEKQMQTQARYVLDPAGMVFTLDFCRSHSWEIVGNELYFVQTGRNHEDDTTTMEQDIEQFVREIKPAIARPLSDLAKELQTPYGEDVRTTMMCPMCVQELIRHKDYLTCPQQHGLLVKIKDLDKININKILPHQLRPGQVTTRPSQITCPHCAAPMEQSGFNGSRTMIDVCLSCPYRWLEAGEYRA